MSFRWREVIVAHLLSSSLDRGGRGSRVVKVSDHGCLAKEKSPKSCLVKSAHPGHFWWIGKAKQHPLP
ncbi:hypothetical protein TNCV_2345081 [Trichonephila clavipes]|nr:hypothetical protein TNCV_2345081 [Trichonephila clavipes]